MSSNLNWADHDKDIVEFVRRVTNFYLRTEASTGELLPPNKGILLYNNYATPRLLSVLLTYLSNLSADQVESKLAEIRRACAMAGLSEQECKAGVTTYASIFNDFEKWMQRFEGYVRETQAAMQRNPDASGNEDPVFWDNVTKPLLLGLYPGEKIQRRLDAVSPLIMAWQLEVAKDAYREAREMFWEDLKQSAKDVVSGVVDYGAAAILFGLGALFFGYGYAKGK